MRTFWFPVAAVCLVALLPHAVQGQAAQAKGVKTVTPDALSWQPVEGDPEARVAVLYGNPAEAGHFVVRYKLPPSRAGRPHTHGGTELITVHSGTCYLAYGDDLSREAAKKLSAGALIAMPAGTKMRGFTGEDGCVADVQGQGPLTTQYLDGMMEEGKMEGKMEEGKMEGMMEGGKMEEGKMEEGKMEGMMEEGKMEGMMEGGKMEEGMMEEGQAAQAKGVKTVTPDALSWQPVEGDPEARVAVLYGNPAEAGHFVVRYKLPPSRAGRPHTHGGTELITVHSGTCYLAYGDDLSREAAKKLSAGALIAMPAGTKMRGFTGEDGCVADVQGQGPLTTQYLDEEGT